MINGRVTIPACICKSSRVRARNRDAIVVVVYVVVVLCVHNSFPFL